MLSASITALSISNFALKVFAVTLVSFSPIFNIKLLFSSLNLSSIALFIFVFASSTVKSDISIPNIDIPFSIFSLFILNKANTTENIITNKTINKDTTIGITLFDFCFLEGSAFLNFIESSSTVLSLSSFFSSVSLFSTISSCTLFSGVSSFFNSS